MVAVTSGFEPPSLQCKTLLTSIESTGRDKDSDNHFHTGFVISIGYAHSHSSIIDAEPRFWLYINVADLLTSIFTHINGYVPELIQSLHIHFDWSSIALSPSLDFVSKGLVIGKFPFSFFFSPSQVHLYVHQTKDALQGRLYLYCIFYCVILVYNNLS